MQGNAGTSGVMYQVGRRHAPPACVPTAGSWRVRAESGSWLLYATGWGVLLGYGWQRLGVALPRAGQGYILHWRPPLPRVESSLTQKRV